MINKSPNPQTPIACLLNDEEQRERKQHLQQELFSHVTETTELEDGFAYRFPGDRDVVDQLIDFVLFERECCPFFTFDLGFEPEHGPVTLSLRGPEGVKEFLYSNQLA
jgi:hypothetical protein